MALFFFFTSVHSCINAESIIVIPEEGFNDKKKNESKKKEVFSSCCNTNMTN